jgi:quinol monooxygenase YgiN
MIIVAGTIQVSQEAIAAMRERARTMVTATRAEAGCRVYSFAEDLAEPGLVRIFEIWDSQEALQAHFATPHMAAWRAAMAQFEVKGAKVSVYDAAHVRDF